MWLFVFLLATMVFVWVVFWSPALHWPNVHPIIPWRSYGRWDTGDSVKDCTLHSCCTLAKNSFTVATALSLAPRSLAPWYLVYYHLPGPWYSSVQLSPWLLDRSHQSCFGQTCSPITLYLPPIHSLVFFLPHKNTHPVPYLHIFRQSTSELDILWHIHLTLPQITAEKTEWVVLTALSAFATAWSEASIYEKNHISASCADFLMSVIYL